MKVTRRKFWLKEEEVTGLVNDGDSSYSYYWPLSLKAFKQLPGDLWRRILSQAQNGEKN